MLSQPLHFFVQRTLLHMWLQTLSVGVGEFSIYLQRYLELEACTILAQFKKKKKKFWEI